jgi:hypothetical protein
MRRRPKGSATLIWWRRIMSSVPRLQQDDARSIIYYNTAATC